MDTPEKAAAARRLFARMGLEESHEQEFIQWLEALSEGNREKRDLCGLLRLSRVGDAVAAILMTVCVVTAEEAVEFPEHFSYEGLVADPSNANVVSVEDDSGIRIVECMRSDQGPTATIYDSRIAIVPGVPGNRVARFDAQTNTMSIGATLSAAFREWIESIEWLSSEVDASQ
jgi:hypothetical protein